MNFYCVNSISVGCLDRFPLFDTRAFFWVKEEFLLTLRQIFHIDLIIWALFLDDEVVGRLLK